MERLSRNFIFHSGLSRFVNQLFIQLFIQLFMHQTVWACNFCMMGQGVSPYLVSNGRGLLFDINYTESDQTFNKATDISSPKKEGWLTYGLTGFYSVTEDLSLLVTLPYAVKTNIDFDSSSNTTPGQLTNGLGDITLSGRYTLLSHHTLTDTLLVGVQGGIKLPTGSTHILDASGNPVDRHALPGTGSFDFPMGVTSSYSFGGRYQLTADLVYSIAGNGNWAGDPHRFGNSLNYNFKSFYKILPTEPGEKSLFVYVGFSGETTDRELGVRTDSGYLANMVNLSTGGTVLFWNVGVYSNLGASTVINVGLAEAFYHYMNYDPNFDSDPSENYKLSVSVTTLF